MLLQSFKPYCYWSTPVNSHPKYGIAVCLLLAALLQTSTALAGAIHLVSIQSANIARNGSGEVSVLVTGDSSPINLVGYEFQISPLGGATSQLQFLEESESFLGDANYLFAGNSFAAGDGLPSTVGTVSTSILPSDTFIGGDNTNDFADVAISGSKLLVKLALQHLVGPADPDLTIGHQFSISLVPSSGDSNGFGGGTSNTGLLSSSMTGVAFSSQAGVVTVVEIPEPSAIISALGLVGIALGLRRHSSIRIATT